MTAFRDGGGPQPDRSTSIRRFGTFGGLFDSPGYTVWNAGASWRRDSQPSRSSAGSRTSSIARYEEALGFPALGRGAIAGLRIAAGR